MQTDPEGNLRRVGTLSLWDIQGSYTGFKNITLTLGAKNMFDTDPPLTNQNNTFQVASTVLLRCARALRVRQLHLFVQVARRRRRAGSPRLSSRRQQVELARRRVPAASGRYRRGAIAVEPEALAGQREAPR